MARYAQDRHHSNSAKHDQNQYDNQHEAEPAAAVVAHPVEGASTDAAESSEQCDNENDEQDRSDGHEIVPSFESAAKTP